MRTTLPRWAEDAAQLCIRIRRASLESELSALLGRPVRASADFDLAHPLSTPQRVHGRADGACPRLRPRTVARAIALIEEHPEAQYTIGDLARHAGVSARRLQQGLRENVGMTPTELLRRTRLERAHRDLLNGEDAVTDVALRWGFRHLSRLAQAYRQQCGVLPSETRRTRGTMTGS
jgi:AraC-like DNA-binding protein